MVEHHCSYSGAKCYVESSIFNSNSVDGFGGAILIYGDLTIKNCTFNKNYGGSGGGAIYTNNLQVISDQNNTEIYTSFFSENTVGSNVIGEKNGGAISAKSANIENAYFYKNQADFHGGAIFTDGDLNVNNCLFESNKATGAYVATCYGGAIKTNKNLKVNNSIFKENSAEDYGGAIYADTASIYSSSFEKNEVTMSTINYVKLGGAIYVVNSVNIFDSIFDSNHALVDGGAVYGKHGVSVKNTTFMNNKADGSSKQCYGGAIRSEGDVKVDNSTFEGNHAYDYGGAIYADTITWVNTPSYFIKNYVDDNQGGAIYTNKFTTDVAYGVFIGNQVKANDDGGAIYINNENHITFTHCIFKDNWCGDEGGAIYLDSMSSDLTLKDGNSFINNYAGNQGLDVFNKGTYGTIKNNWWGVASPNFEWGQLIEWKFLPWESNIKHSDSNPLPSPPDGYVPTLNADYLTKVYRNDTQYKVTFYDSEYKPLENTSISFDINNVTYYRTTDENGVASLNIRLTSGIYTIKTTNPVTGEIVYKKAKVISNIFRDYDLIKYYKNDTQYTVTILSKDGHAVGAGETVTFNVNGITYTRTTDANGNVTLNINLEAGDYTITTEYDGVKDFHKIQVLPVLSAEDLTKKVGAADQFVATLLDGQGKVLSGETVTFNINGVYYQSVTDVEGHAKLNIDLIPGEYIITSNYNGANVANKITITS